MKVSVSNYEILIPVAVRSKAWVCDRLIAEIARSNPADFIVVCVLCLSCVV